MSKITDAHKATQNMLRHFRSFFEFVEAVEKLASFEEEQKAIISEVESARAEKSQLEVKLHLLREEKIDVISNIERSKQLATELVADADKKAAALIENANKSAEEIIEAANREASELRKSFTDAKNEHINEQRRLTARTNELRNTHDKIAAAIEELQQKLAQVS